MRYLVKAKLKPGKKFPLLQAVNNNTLGAGSIAGGEYIKNMLSARQLRNETVCWVEVCYCPTPLDEERPYWEEYFDLIKIKNAHGRQNCKDLNGMEPWSCSTCDCTEKLEQRMEGWGERFLKKLQGSDSVNSK